jgi:hypothetical protein
MPPENPAIDDPLICGDWWTIQPHDVVAADQILPGFLSEFAHPRHRMNPQRYWLDKQEPGEMTMFCSFDSNKLRNTGSK